MTGAAQQHRDDVLVSRIDGGALPVTRMERGFVVLGPFAVYGLGP